MFSVLQNAPSLIFRYPISVRLSHATGKNKAGTADEEESPTQSARPAISRLSPPRLSNAFAASRAQSLILRSQRTTTTSCTRVSSPASRSCPTPWSSMVTTVRKAPIRISPASCLPPDFSRSDSTMGPPKPHTRTVLEHLLSGAPNPSAPSDRRCVPTPSAAATLTNGLVGLCRWALATHLRGHPEDLLRAIWSNSLCMLLLISSLVHRSIVSNTCVCLGQGPSRQIMRLRPTRPLRRCRVRY